METDTSSAGRYVTSTRRESLSLWREAREPRPCSLHKKQMEARVMVREYIAKPS